MSNVIHFRKKVEADRFPTYELDPTIEYDEIEPLYVREGIRLGLLVEKGEGPTPFYLALHDGSGGNLICLRIWQPSEVAALGGDGVASQALMVARALDHNWKVLRA